MPFHISGQLRSPSNSKPFQTTLSSAKCQLSFGRGPLFEGLQNILSLLFLVMALGDRMSVSFFKSSLATLQRTVVWPGLSHKSNMY